MNLKQKVGKDNYHNGRNFEIKVMNRLKRQNKIKLVIHSSGSFGLFDLMAIRYDGKIVLVSCKTSGYLPPKERKELIDYMETKQTENEIIQLWYYKSARKFTKKIITTKDMEA